MNDPVAHDGSPVAIAVADVSLRAEFAAYRTETEKRIADLEAENVHARLAALEALAKNEFTPTLNEHDDRLDDAEGSLERHEIRLDRHESSLTRIGLVMDSIERNTRLLIDHFKIADSSPKPTPRER